MDGTDSSEVVVSGEGQEDVGADETEEKGSNEPGEAADTDQIRTSELPSGEGETAGEPGEKEGEEAGVHEEVGEEGAIHPGDNGQEVGETEGGQVEVMTQSKVNEEKEEEGKGEEEEEERKVEGRVEEEGQQEKAEEQEITYDYEELKSGPEAVNLSPDISLKLQYPSLHALLL